jgi:hypothetical protein
MELLTWITLGVLGVLGSVFVHILALDIHGHAPAFAARLVALAVRLLPPEQRARYQEEWFAHLDEAPGALAKLAHALGCLRAAHGVAKATRPAWLALTSDLKWYLRRRFAKTLVTKVARGDFAGARSTWSLINSTVHIIRKHLLVLAANKDVTEEDALRVISGAVIKAAEELRRKYDTERSRG